MGNEGYIQPKEGEKRQDAPIHEKILSNKEASDAADRRAINQALKDGLTADEAEFLYKSPPGMEGL